MKKVLCVNGPNAATVVAVTGRDEVIMAPQFDSSGHETGKVLEYEIVLWATLNDKKNPALGGDAYLVGVSRAHKEPTASEVLNIIVTTKFKRLRKLTTDELAR